jgi:tetratricopeptide (TPR) repeat protein
MNILRIVAVLCICLGPAALLSGEPDTEGLMLMYKDGLRCYKEMQYQKAEKRFAYVIREGWNLAKVRYALAESQYQLGKRDEAVKNFEKCLELDPEYPKAAVRLAKLKASLITVKKEKEEWRDDYNENLNLGDRIFLYAGAGISSIRKVKDYGDYWKSGYNFGAGIDVMFTRLISVQSYCEYNQFKFDSISFSAANGLDSGYVDFNGGTIKIINVFANLKLALPIGKGRLYLLGGGGSCSFRLSTLTITIDDEAWVISDEEESAFALNGGAGMDLAFSSHLGFFAEFRYVHGVTRHNPVVYMPIKVGLVVMNP